MSEVDVFDVLREAVMTSLLVAGPVMAVGLVVGLLVSLFQALTQLQEASLAFVPKIIAVFVALVVFGPFMLTTLIGFTHNMADRIVALH
ncbi:MAG TPA: flagellar biosynthesis protein FliQ [Alphaproteobacteria bacterium]|nr:flagellar biosynthesis protein FliQ [Alphaproteobacteria bacterium]